MSVTPQFNTKEPVPAKPRPAPVKRKARKIQALWPVSPSEWFARLGDYTRERIGLGSREVEELARVARPLLIFRAFKVKGV